MELAPSDVVANEKVDRLNLIAVKVESNNPLVFMKTIELVKEKLSGIVATFLADRAAFKAKFQSTKFAKHEIFTCCRDSYETEDPSVVFVQPIFYDKTLANLRLAFGACAQNEVHAGKYLYEKQRNE